MDKGLKQVPKDMKAKELKELLDVIPDDARVLYTACGAEELFDAEENIFVYNQKENVLVIDTENWDKE